MGFLSKSRMRFAFIALSLLLTISMRAALALPAGLVVDYTGNGTANDTTGTYNATFTGSYVAGMNGQQAFNLSNGNFSAPQAELPSGASSRTMSFWINPQADATAVYGGLGYGGSTYDSQFDLYYNTVANQWSYYTSYWGAYQIAFNQTGWSFGGPTLTPGQWSYLAVTFNGSLVSIYLNGNLYVSSGLAGGANGTINTTVSSGTLNGLSAPEYLQNIHIYNTALTTTQIQQDYQASLPEPSMLSLDLMAAMLVVVAVAPRRRNVTH